MKRERVPRSGVGIGALVICAAVALSGCNPRSTPIARAFHFLQHTQVTEEEVVVNPDTGAVDFRGNWPQYFHLKVLPELKVRDASPFIVAFIHHGLTLVNEANVETLGLTVEDAAEAEMMRARAREFMRRFASSPDAPDAGTFGFWPLDQRAGEPETPLDGVLLDLLWGPQFFGTRAPFNFRIYPSRMAIPPDADVTSLVYASFLDDPLVDALPDGPAIALLFADWTDTGAQPRRFNPPWLPVASGLYLTWLDYRDPPNAAIPNDVDLVVNANVLYALARYGQTATPGFDEAIALINQAVALGIHRNAPQEIAEYYPDNYAFHYCVSRAFREGPVPELEPAVEQLADELEDSAIVVRDTAHWDRGAPHLNTALAALTLLNAGRSGPVLDGAIAYLIREQDPVKGNWDEGAFFVARTDAGPEFLWVSEAFTTAIALEALCRYELHLVD